MESINYTRDESPATGTRGRGRGESAFSPSRVHKLFSDGFSKASAVQRERQVWPKRTN